MADSRGERENSSLTRIQARAKLRITFWPLHSAAKPIITKPHWQALVFVNDLVVMAESAEKFEKND